MGKKTKKTLEKRVKTLEKLVADMATNQRTLTDMVIAEKFGNKPKEDDVIRVPEVRVSPVETTTCGPNDDETMRFYFDKVNLGKIAKLTTPYGYIMTFTAVLIDHLGDSVTRYFSFNPNGEDDKSVVFNFATSSEYDENQLRLSYNTASSVIDAAVRRLLESVDTYKPDNINLVNLAASVTSMVDDVDDFEVLRGVNDFEDINTDDDFMIYESAEVPKNGYSYEYQLMKLVMTFEYNPIYDTKNIDFTIKEEEENNG